MSVIENFERKALFNITRAVALVCVIVFLLGIVGAGLYGASVWKTEVSTKVAPEEIVNQVKPPAVADTSSQGPKGAQPPTDTAPRLSPLYGYRIPFSLQKYISGDNAQIVKNHMDTVPVDERQAYLDELGDVVSVAESSKIDPVDAINAYFKTKAERYERAAREREHKKDTLKLVGAAIATGLLTVALFSLVLVLLAIERNTRVASTQKATSRMQGNVAAEGA
ncbi:hypothetical protein [Ralstonia solanacearum]|uniref:hypothetical protein n=1 Tax=Ralstonia solanacearum TaxID=305 RepID=UPI000AE45B2F|nr:hypothetical protein [Ralstonia solanacearum]